jgi:hypothetical protein
MLRKLILWSVAIICIAIWRFPLTVDSPDAETPELKTVANATLTQGDLMSIKNGKFVISETSRLHGIDPVVKILQEGTPVKLLSRSAVFDFKVELGSGEIGYLNYFDIDDLRNMIAKKPVAIYEDEKTNHKTGEIETGTKGRLIDIRNNYGTLAFILDDGKKVFIGSNSGMGWADSLMIDDLPKEDQSSAQGISITRNRLDRDFIGKDFDFFEEYLSTPDAYVKHEGDSATAHYSQVSVFDDNRLKKEVIIHFKGGIAQSYTLGAKSHGTFFGSFPLTGFVADFGWPALITQQFAYQHKTYLDQLLGGAWYAVIAGLLVMLVMMILIFSIPYYITFPFYYILIRVRQLNNTVVTSMCLGLMYLLFYLWFLTFFIHFDSKQPLIYFIICIGLAVYYTIVIRGRIAYHRCPNCHTVYSASHEGTDLLGVRKLVTRVTNNVFTGTTESSDTITHHYEKRSHDEVKTEKTFADKRKCHHCGYSWSVERKETK